MIKRNKDLVIMDIDKKTLVKKQKKQSICPVCGKSFDKSNGKIFCSKECRIKQKGYPSKEEVIIKYEELKSQQKVANFYGLTRKIIINILKNVVILHLYRLHSLKKVYNKFVYFILPNC